MMHPIFLTFKDGDYPDKMPASVKSALQAQNREYSSLSSEKEQNTYKIKWMIEHIKYERSSDPAGGAFVKKDLTTLNIQKIQSELLGKGDSKLEDALAI